LIELSQYFASGFVLRYQTSKNFLYLHASKEIFKLEKIIKICATKDPVRNRDILRAADIAISENPLNEPKDEIKRSLNLNLEEDKIRLAMATGKKWKPG
jgi:hypothetical protein